MKYFHITIPINNPNEQLVLVLEFTVALQRMARKQGGDGRIMHINQYVKIEVSGISGAMLESCLKGLTVYLIKKGLEMEIATAVRTTPSIPDGIQVGEHLCEKLTQRFLLSLPTGAFLISRNIDPHHLHPVWVGQLLPSTNYSVLWAEAKSAGATGKHVLVVWKFEDYLLLANSWYRDYLHNYTKQVES